MAAFLGKGLGGRRADALGGAGDQDAFAAQMQVHGNTRCCWGGSEKRSAELVGGSRHGRQHCTAALRESEVWSIAGRENRRHLEPGKSQGCSSWPTQRNSIGSRSFPA